MTFQLTLPPELEERLRREAERQKLSADVVTLKLLDAHLPPVDRRAAAIAMLERWTVEDEAMTEQERASNADVLRAVDEDRLSDRQLFADILKEKAE